MKRIGASKSTLYTPQVGWPSYVAFILTCLFILVSCTEKEYITCPTRVTLAPECKQFVRQTSGSAIISNSEFGFLPVNGDSIIMSVANTVGSVFSSVCRTGSSPIPAFKYYEVDGFSGVINWGLDSIGVYYSATAGDADCILYFRMMNHRNLTNDTTYSFSFNFAKGSYADTMFVYKELYNGITYDYFRDTNYIHVSTEYTFMTSSGNIYPSSILITRNIPEGTALDSVVLSPGFALTQFRYKGVTFQQSSHYFAP